MPTRPPMVGYWLRTSSEDLASAETLIAAGHTRMAMFCCHLAVEKAIKAVLKHKTNTLPPRIHDLRLLLARTQLQPTATLKRFVDRMNGLSIPTRYPGPLSAAPLVFRRRDIQRSIVLTQEFVKWCEQNC